MRARSLRVAALIAALLTGGGSAMAQNCLRSSIVSPSPFMGNNGEIFRLTDGSLWEVQFEYEYLYEYYPDVIICPSMGTLIVSGKKLNVRQLQGGAAPAARVAPAPSPRRPATVHCETGHWVDSVSNDGQFVMLEDGSAWLIALADTVDTMLWLPTTDITVCGDQLINTEDNETVTARRIR